MLMVPRPHFSPAMDTSTANTAFVDAASPFPAVADADFVQNSPFAFADYSSPVASHIVMAANGYRQPRPAMPQQQQQDWHMAQQPPRKRFRGAGPATQQQRSFSKDAAHKNLTSSPQQPLQHLPTPSQTPTQGFLDAPSFYNTSRPQQSAMSAALSLNAAFDQPFGAHDDMPAYAHSVAHSVSSYGHDSPATPRTVSGEDNNGLNTGEAPADDAFSVNLDDYLLFPAQDFSALPKFDRPLSDASYGEDLFGQAVFAGSASSAAAYNHGPVDASLLSPYRHSMSERLQAANHARATSPMDSTQRQSPFRPESPYARPVADFATASGVRQRQKAEADALAYQQHHNRPRTVELPTISPQDALLEYHENGADQPLFPPASSAALASAQHLPAFPFQAPSLPNEGSNDLQLYLTPGFRSSQNSSSHLSDAAPLDFPSHLISMETSASGTSDADTADSSARLPNSSQGSNISSIPHAFVCTSAGCTQRFDSPGKLTRHRRESHPQTTTTTTTTSPVARLPWSHQQKQNTSDSAATADSGASDHNDEDADADADSPIGSGMTSAALMARNSQAGPHRCERINPSTGKPCNTIFSRPYDLTRHEDTIHNGHKKKVRCHLCTEEKTFSRSDALTRHMRVVHPDVEFPGKHRRRHV